MLLRGASTKKLDLFKPATSNNKPLVNKKQEIWSENPIVPLARPVPPSLLSNYPDQAQTRPSVSDFLISSNTTLGFSQNLGQLSSSMSWVFSTAPHPPPILLQT